MNIDTDELPKAGNRIRIRIRDNLWMMGEIEKVSPSMTFMTIKVLGMKESDDEVGTPTRLVDSSDPFGPLEPDASGRKGVSRVPRKHAPDDMPPSPALIIENERTENGDGQSELF